MRVESKTDVFDWKEWCISAGRPDGKPEATLVILSADQASVVFGNAAEILSQTKNTPPRYFEYYLQRFANGDTKTR